MSDRLGTQPPEFATLHRAISAYVTARAKAPAAFIMHPLDRDYVLGEVVKAAKLMFPSLVTVDVAGDLRFEGVKIVARDSQPLGIVYLSGKEDEDEGDPIRLR